MIQMSTTNVVILAITARASEVPLAMVLDDDRLPCRLSAIDARIKQEREVVLSLSFGASQRLSESSG